MIGRSSALRLHGVEMPLGRIDDGKVHVVRTHPTSHRGPKGIVVTNPTRHHAARRHPENPRLLIAEPVEAWLQEAEAGASVYDLIVLGDGLVRRSAALATMAQLRSAVENAGCMTGVINLRTALALIRPGTDSPMETHVRLVILLYGLPEPAINPAVALSTLSYLVHPDFGYLEMHVALEYQGDGHRNKWSWRNDEERRRGFVADKWDVIYATGDVVSRPMPFLRALEAALSARGWDGARRLPPFTATQLAMPGTPPA